MYIYIYKFIYIYIYIYIYVVYYDRTNKIQGVRPNRE